MREEFLYHIWKFRKYLSESAKTTEGEQLIVIHPGIQNEYSGPDFFNSRIEIGQQVWAGNVEIHYKSSDWYLHHHEIDAAYDNVILHVVWEEDADIFRKDGSRIPTLEIKNLVDQEILNSYQLLLERPHKVLNCEDDFSGFSDFQLRHWLERLYIERLESKTENILQTLEKTNGNWEATFFIHLAKGFGLNLNGENFSNLAWSFDFNIFQKLKEDQFQLEALLLGQAKLIEGEEKYVQNLGNQYAYLKHKYALNNDLVPKPEFFRLRPDNFPTLRLAQLAALYNSTPAIFKEILEAPSTEYLYQLFSKPKVSEFWDTHYNFGKSHSPRKKRFTKSFIDLILINVIVPVRYTYFKTTASEDSAEAIFSLITAVAPEQNSAIKLFNNLRPGSARNAMHSQSLIHLKKKYCELNKCLSCELGSSLLKKSAKTF